MSGGKGGSTTSTVEVPQYIEDAARRNLLRAQDISQIGYTPYYGPDVAAFTPMQEASFAGTQQLASAFGLPTAGMPSATVGVRSSDYDMGVPAPQTFAGGIRGYSSAPLFEEALDEFGRRRPAQKAFIDRMFIDPFTGEYTPISPDAPVDVPVDAVIGGGGAGGGGGGGANVPFVPVASDVPVTPDVPVVPELPYIPPEFDEPIIPFLPNPFGPDPDPDLVPIGEAEAGDPIAEIPIEQINVGLPPDIQIPDVPGQRFQFYNPDIDYSDAPPPFESGGQYVGTLDPSAEGLAAMEAAYGVSPEVYTEGPDIRSASDFPLGLSTQGYDFSTYADPSKRDRADTAVNQFGSTVSVGYGAGQVDPALAAAAGYTEQPKGFLEGIFGPTSAATQERLADEIAARQVATQNAAQRRESELAGLIQTVGGQELLDTGAQLAGDQRMALERQFGTLTTSEVVDQANLEQKSIPLQKEGMKATRKVLDKAAQEGNLGAYVDSFLDKYSNLERFQEKTGISSKVLKDIEKIAAARG